MSILYAYVNENKEQRRGFVRQKSLKKLLDW